MTQATVTIITSLAISIVHCCKTTGVQTKAASSQVLGLSDLGEDVNTSVLMKASSRSLGLRLAVHQVQSAGFHGTLHLSSSHWIVHRITHTFNRYAAAGECDVPPACLCFWLLLCQGPHRKAHINVLLL